MGIRENLSELKKPIIVGRWDGSNNKYSFDLDNGLTVTFTDGNAIYYRSGDYWMIPLRENGPLGWGKNPQPPTA